MRHKKALVWVLFSLFIFTMVSIAWAEEKTITTTITAREGKKSIIFKNDQGKDINSEISSGRSPITIAGKRGSLNDLKAGMKIKITYSEDGGPNEPSSIEVLQ